MTDDMGYKTKMENKYDIGSGFRVPRFWVPRLDLCPPGCTPKAKLEYEGFMVQSYALAQ